MPPRARRTRGYVEKLPSGSFRAVVYVGVDPLTRKPKYVRETRKTRGEAERELTRLQRDIDLDRHAKSAITVAEAIDLWMGVAELEETTRDRYEDLIRLYIAPTFGESKVGKLNAELLERFYSKLHRCKLMCPARPAKGHVHQPLSSSTTRKIHYILRGALERAVRWDYVSVNAAAMAHAPTAKKTRPDPPSADEAARLLNDAWQDPEWGMQLWLTMVTGCRRGELCAIRWRNIDFDRANLWLEKSTAQPRSGIMEKDPKNGEGRRVSLDPHTLELLRKHRTDVTEQLFALGVRIADDTYVFSKAPDYSEPSKPKSVTQRYRKMAMRLRLRSTRLHALRHYSATELLAAGVDLRTVAGRLGHGDGITTLRTYAAWVAAADRRAAEQMAELMPVLVPQPPRPRGPYETIAGALRDDIRSGRLKPGDQLPTIVQLAAHYTVAAGTAHRAIAALAAEGLIKVSRGKRAVVNRDAAHADGRGESA
jgi:integrase